MNATMIQPKGMAASVALTAHLFNPATFSKDEMDKSLVIERLRQVAEARTEILNAILARSDRFTPEFRHWGINE